VIPSFCRGERVKRGTRFSRGARGEGSPPTARPRLAGRVRVPQAPSDDADCRVGPTARAPRERGAAAGR
jgi:hypothetical protein